METIRRVHPIRALVLALLALGSILLGIALPSVAASANAQMFGYESWNVRYEIGVDAEGRAVAHVSETITARFPDFDQNRGIVRGLPIDYEGSPTDPRDFTVTDANGAPVPFAVEREDGFVAVLTGDDAYVHGRQTYVIEYTLSDVVLAREDGRADEFYWDVMDSEHAQSVDSFTAEIAFSPELADRMNGDLRCYTGSAGSNAECSISEHDAEFAVPSLRLLPRQGVTVAIGLEPGSVVQPPRRLQNAALDWGPLALTAGAGAVGVAGLIVVGRHGARRKQYRGTVVAQYEVPPELPPLIAGSIVGSTGRAAAAEIVHLAVNGAIRIEEGEDQGVFGRGAPRPMLRVLDGFRAPDMLDKAMLQLLFDEIAPGETFVVPKSSEHFSARMRRLGETADAEALKRGFFTKERTPAARVLGFVGLGLAVVGLAATAVALVSRNIGPQPIIAAAVGVVGLVLALVCLSRHRVHTPLGAEWREHLEGVKLFIRVAEQERLQMLQSYTGAERFDDGSVNVIHIYEKLLPYAVLFKLEKEWARTLEVTYATYGTATDIGPAWYPGLGLHGTAEIGGTISQFTSAMTSATSYTSSSSGGSSGGGSVGGGGGGGFSGGR